MRIGRGDNFLLIQKRDPDDVYSPLRVEAAATAFQQRFSAVRDGARIDNSEKTIHQLEALKFEPLLGAAV